MNIWILNHYAFTPDTPGGTRHFDFSLELLKRGYEVTIFASSFHHNLLKETKNYTSSDFCIENYSGVKFVWVKTFLYSCNNWRRVVNMLSYSFRVHKISTKLVGTELSKPDIIIGSSVHLFGVFTAYLLSKKFKAPFIMEVRDLWPETLICMGVPRWHPFVILLGILERFLYKKADKIITLLPKANDYIEKFGVDKDKIVWIPNGVDVNRFERSILNVERKKSTKFVAMYAGSIGKANNIPLVIEAAEILQDSFPQIKFLIIGDGAERKRMERLVEAKGLKNIEFQPATSKDNIPELLLSSDALLLLVKDSPLYKYGVSFNKLYDYMYSGKPVIFSSNSINNPVKEANAGITVSPEDPKEFAEAIVKIYRMSGCERLEMGKRGKEYVAKFHAIPVLVDKLEMVIKEVMK